MPLTITENSGNDQRFLQWGIQSRHYDTTDPANKRLMIEAEAMTPLSTSGGTALAGASGGTVVRNSDLTTSYQAVLSTTLTAGTTHLGHVGTYRVWGRFHRPTSNAGAVDVALEWAEGDFRRFTQNPAASFPADDREGVFTHTDLGLVHLTEAAQGTQRWEGRVLARSTTTGDELDVDCLYFFPVDEGYGEVRAVANQPTLTSYTARDEFEQASATFTGTAVLPVGGTWSRITGSTDDGDDFSIDTTNDKLVRSASSDANDQTGRYAIAGSLNPTAIAVQVSFLLPIGTSNVNRSGVFARLVDINNWVLAAIRITDAGPVLRVYKRVGGTVSLLGEANVYSVLGFDEISGWSGTVRLDVSASGQWVGWAGASPTSLRELVSGQDAALATGGTLDDGRIGIYDSYTAAGAPQRQYDDFAAWVPSADAALFASQSLELRHDRVIREDSLGTLWTTVSDYQGAFLKIPPSGLEDRQVRIIVKASRSLPESGADSGVDDIAARLTFVPRYLQIPG